MKASQIVQRLNDEAENQIDTFLVNLNATQSTSTFNVINSLHQDIHNGIGHTLSNLVYSPSEPETVADHILPHIILRGGAFLHLTPKLLSDASYWWSCHETLLLELAKLGLVVPILQIQDADEWDSCQYSSEQIELLKLAKPAPFKTTQVLKRLHPGLNDQFEYIRDRLSAKVIGTPFDAVKDTNEGNLRSGAFRIASIYLVDKDAGDQIMTDLANGNIEDMVSSTDFHYRRYFGPIITCHGGHFVMSPTMRSKYLTTPLQSGTSNFAMVDEADWGYAEFAAEVFRQLLESQSRLPEIADYRCLRDINIAIPTAKLISKWAESGHWNELQKFRSEMQSAFAIRNQSAAKASLDNYIKSTLDKQDVLSSGLFRGLIGASILWLIHDVTVSGSVNVGALGLVLTTVSTELNPTIRKMVSKKFGTKPLFPGDGSVKAIASFQEFQKSVETVDKHSKNRRRRIKRN